MQRRPANAWRIGILALAGFHTAAQQAPAAPLPGALIGSWQVDSVLIDMGAPRTLFYQKNDLRLKGRIVTVAPAKITTDLAEDKSCGMPSVSARRTTVGALIGETMAERGVPSKRPTPLDYKLEIAASTALEAWNISCDQGSLGPGGKTNGTWITVLPDGHMAMRWYDETILRLAKLAGDARPNPSFACGKAGTDSEKAICGSVSLSAFDRSMADSYSAGLKALSDPEDREDLEKLRKEQREWIAKRNSCRTDAACLEKSMQSRLEELSGIQ